MRFLLTVLFCFSLLPAQAMASAITLGYINCVPKRWKSKAPKLSIHWGQSCAGGRSCSRMMGIRFKLRAKTYSLHYQPKMSPGERKALHLWRSNPANVRYPRGGRGYRGMGYRVYPKHTLTSKGQRGPTPRPVRKYKVTQKACRVGRRHYFRLSFRDWKKRSTWIEIVPKRSGYKLRVKAAYTKKANTRGWLSGYRCSFRIRGNFTCKQLRKWERQRRKLRKKR